MRGIRADFDRLLESNGVQPGAAHNRRLDWLIGRFGSPMLWRGDPSHIEEGGIVVVLEPPTGPGVELLRSALRPGCTVVIPFGENPAFDFLKCKLIEFGTVGPCGAECPHEMWWGGVDWSVLNAVRHEVPPPLVISCYPRDRGEEDARRLRRALTTLRLDCHIEPIETALSDRMLAFEKVNFIFRTWRQHGVPILFVDPGALLQEPPLLPARLECDFAVHKWSRWEMSARTLYFSRSAAAESLLQSWQDLATSYPEIWDGYLLDQAWSLTSSRMPIETIWLPRSYHAAPSDIGRERQATIVHSLAADTTELGPDPSFAQLARAARRAGRTGAREALIVVKSSIASAEAITVILRDVAKCDAREVAAAIKAVTRAFVADCGGFGRLELSLCPWQDDATAAAKAAQSAKQRVLEVVPRQALPENLFRTLACSRGGSIVAMADVTRCGGG